MNINLKYIFGFIIILTVSGCTSMKPSDFTSNEPKLVLEEYFLGQSKAWGIFEDRFGNIRRQFFVDINGTMDGNTLILDESFVFSDGEKSTRQWRIKKTDEGHYVGEADDVVGLAHGVASGNALNWQYILDLSIGENSKMKVKFNDWMFLQPDGVLLNRARVSKFGVEIGQVTIAFVKS